MRKWICTLLFFSLPLFYASFLYGGESIYNLVVSELPDYKSYIFEIRTSAGTRYIPPSWSRGVEIWSDFQAGMSDQISMKISTGYNLSSGHSGFGVGGGFRILKSDSYEVSLALELLRETEGVFTFHTGFLATYRIGLFEFSLNNYLDKSFSKFRDPFDWHLTLAFSGRKKFLIYGFEYLGEDLEDLWEREEAEGGANNFVGLIVGIDLGNYGIAVTPGYSLGPRKNYRGAFLFLGKIWFTI